jgi:hypothetical protein
MKKICVLALLFFLFLTSTAFTDISNAECSGLVRHLSLDSGERYIMDNNYLREQRYR